MDHFRPYLQHTGGVGFLGNYLPRECGIATFTHDLSNAVAKQIDPLPVIVAAMNDQPEGYAYPDAVNFEIREAYRQDYENAADYFNCSGVDVVSVQHEYGIFGGEWGSNLLSFMKRLKKPSVVTCHTVLEKPEKAPLEILQEIAAYASKLVVMSDRAVHFLESAYDIPRSKIVCVPHGIHDVPFIDPSYFKDKFNVEGQRVLLTFGLLRREKGIEHVIKALPKVIAQHPDTAYIVLGATHPAVVRMEGEFYRLGLQRLARELGVHRHIHFYSHFVDLDGLLEYIGAADIFVTPYLSMEQITSGALSYAMGAGKAVISTPYWHAEELLANNRGILVPPNNSDALADAINSLLVSETRLSAMRKRAYLHCRDMIWPAVARRYVQLFETLRSDAPSRPRVPRVSTPPISATQLPTPSIDHLLRMCDATGPARYARFSIPVWHFGYTVDDACGTLVAAVTHYGTYHDQRALKLVETCMELIQTLVGNGRFTDIQAGLTYDRKTTGNAAPQSAAKVLWALGYVITHGPVQHAGFAQDVFHQILPETTVSPLSAAPYIVLGTGAYLRSFPGATFVRRIFNGHLSVLNEALKERNWIDAHGGADWPIAVQAYADALQSLEIDAALLPGLLSQTIARTQAGTLFCAPGVSTQQEELSVTAGAFIAAIVAGYRVTGDRTLLAVMRSAMDWFLGSNRLSVPLYDFTTRGCNDALSTSGLNKNQSTEATVHFLRGLISICNVEINTNRSADMFTEDTDNADTASDRVQTEVA